MLRLVRMAVAFVVIAGSLGLATVAATAQDGGSSCPSDGADNYSDVVEGSTHANDIACLKELGIPAEGDTYRPGDDITRSEMARFMARAYAVITGEAAPVAEHAFTDVADDPNADDIARIAGLEITNGVNPEGTLYAPDAPVIRGHMALFLTRLYTAVAGADAPAGETEFTDIGERSDEQQAAIGQIFALGVTTGTSDTTYSPSDNVTREQMASFVARMHRVLDALPDPSVAPGAPTGVTATVSGDAGTALDVSWTAPEDTGTEDLTGYTVQWKSGDDDYVNQRTVTGTSTTVGGLESGVTYTFRVAAASDVGQGAWSDETSATPETAATVPGEVNDFVASTGNTTLTLSWAPPTDDGGSPITGYKIQLSKNREAPQTVEVGDVTTHTVTGLDNTANYRVFIQAVNAVGEGTITPLTSPTSGLPGVPVRTGPAPADAPQELTLAQKSNPATQQKLAGVDISWKTPRVGSTTLTGYSIEHRCGTATTWTALTALDYDSDDDGTVDTGIPVVATSELDASTAPLGTSCDVRVQSVPPPASNSYAYASITLTGAPPDSDDAPTTVAVTGFNKSLLVTWGDPTDGGDNTGYKVAWSSGTPIGDHTVDARTRSYTITGLTNGAAYTVTVAAVNAAGTGTPTATTPATGTPIAVPSAPGNVRAALPPYTAGQTVAYGGQELNVSWSAPASNSSNFVTSYTVQTRTSKTATDPAGEWTDATGAVNVGAGTVTITGLTNDTSYDVRVSATSSVGTSPWSTFASATPVAPVGAPSAIAAEIVSNRMTITWNPQAATNVTGYQIRYGTPPGQGTWATVNAAATDVRRTVGVSSGRDYDFQVRTKFAIGGVTSYSAWSDSDTSTTTVFEPEVTSTADAADNPRSNGPSAPGTVTAAVVAQLTGTTPTPNLSVTWSRVVHSNVSGATVSGYEMAYRLVTADPTVAASWTAVTVSAIEAGKLKKTIGADLVAGMKYEVRVRATATSDPAEANAIKGAWAYSSVVTAMQIPVATTGVVATVSLIPDGPVAVIWAHVAQPNPLSDVTGYVVTWWRTGSSNLPGGSATSVMVDGRTSKSYLISTTGLSPGVYNVNVQAVNGVGRGIAPEVAAEAMFTIAP